MYKPNLKTKVENGKFCFSFKSITINHKFSYEMPILENAFMYYTLFYKYMAVCNIHFKTSLSLLNLTRSTTLTHHSHLSQDAN